MILIINVSFLWLGLELPADIVHWDVYNDSFNREFWPYVFCVCLFISFCLTLCENWTIACVQPQNIISQANISLENIE